MSKSEAYWSTEETVIIVYFVSRNFDFRTTVASEVMRLRGYTARDPKYCSNKVVKIRKGIRDRKEPDFYVNSKYDLDLVDAWLSSQIPNKGKLEDLLGIKDGKIVDDKVLEILKEYV